MTVLSSNFQINVQSMCAGWHVHTFELVPGVEDSHVCRNGVKPTAPNDVDSFLSCLAAVVQLHALQKLYTDRKKQKLTSVYMKKNILFLITLFSFTVFTFKSN